MGVSASLEMCMWNRKLEVAIRIALFAVTKQST